MPEVAVDENDYLAFEENEVGTAKQLATAPPAGNPELSAEADEAEFRRPVPPASDARHHPGPLGGSVAVRAAANPLADPSRQFHPGTAFATGSSEASKAFI